MIYSCLLALVPLQSDSGWCMAVETSEGAGIHPSNHPGPCFSPPDVISSSRHSQLEPSPIPPSPTQSCLRASRLSYQRATTTDHQKFIFSGDFFFLCDISAFISCIPESTLAPCHQPLNLVGAAGSTSSSGIHATITFKTASARSPHPSNDWQPYDSRTCTTGIFNVRFPLF
jgi:hypothetical protein